MFKKEDFDTIRPWVLFVLVCTVLGLALMKWDNIIHILKSIVNLLTPLYYGMAFAFIINIPMKKIEKFILEHYPNLKKHNTARAISLVSAVLIIVLIISGIVVLLAPRFYNAVFQLIGNITKYLDNIEEVTNTLLSRFDIEYQVSFDTIFNKPTDEFLSTIVNYLTTNYDMFVKNAKNFSGVLGDIGLGIMLSFYILTGKENFKVNGERFIKAVFGEYISSQMLRIGHLTVDIFERFIGGQLVEMFILGFIFFVGLSIFRIPNALLISVVTGISGIIPIIGAFMSMAFGCILVLGSKDLMWVIGFIILYQMLQQFENNFIYPRVVGGQVGIPGIFVLLSIIIFGSLFGALGMIVAVPSMAVIYSLISEFVDKRVPKETIK